MIQNILEDTDKRERFMQVRRGTLVSFVRLFSLVTALHHALVFYTECPSCRVRLWI